MFGVAQYHFLRYHQFYNVVIFNIIKDRLEYCSSNLFLLKNAAGLQLDLTTTQMLGYCCRRHSPGCGLTFQVANSNCSLYVFYSLFKINSNAKFYSSKTIRSLFQNFSNNFSKCRVPPYDFLNDSSFQLCSIA